MPAVLVKGLLLRRTRCFFPNGSRTITSTHYAYPRRDGQTKLAWVAGYTPKWYPAQRWSPIPVYINRAQRKSNFVIDTPNAVTAMLG